MRTSGPRPLLLLSVVAACLALTACGDSTAPRSSTDPGSGLLYAHGRTVHFPSGAEVRAAHRVLAVHPTRSGVVVEYDVAPGGNQRGAYAFVGPGGEVHTLDVPSSVILDSDPAGRYVAWTRWNTDEGIVHVLDPATAEEVARIRHARSGTDRPVSVDGDTVWLHGVDYRETFRLDRVSGRVTRARAVGYAYGIAGGHAVVQGGNENVAEAGLARPGVIDVGTGELVLPGHNWSLSPDGSRASRMTGDGDSRTRDGRVVVADLASGRTVRFPIGVREDRVADTAWTPDGRRVYWFEGDEAVACPVTGGRCTTTQTGAAGRVVVPD